MNIPKPITYHQWKHPEEYISAEPQELFDNILFPLVQRVAARTIGLDLVPVQPMAAPIGVLQWLDFAANPASPKTIVERIPKPLPYKKWKQQQAIIKKWEDSGILEGLRGNQLLEPGYVYAPYIPVELTPEVIAPPNFNPNRTIRSRYARRLVNNNFYGTVRIAPEEE